MYSDGGRLVLREIEQRLGIAKRLAGCIRDPRDPARVEHGLDEIIRFRTLMIATGYEDGNDAEAPRDDPMFKLAMERLPDDPDLCSQSTISPAENLPDARALVRMGRAMVDTIARAFGGCRAASCSTSTTRSTPFTAASNSACSTRMKPAFGLDPKDEHGFQPIVVFDSDVINCPPSIR